MSDFIKWVVDDPALAMTLAVAIPYIVSLIYIHTTGD